MRCGLAILTAVAQAEGPDGRPIQVGIGVHAGETVETDEGYVGSVVNIAARVCARASAGELLVTDAVRALTATYLRVGFQARGRHRLKGIAEPVALYRVTVFDHGLAGRASWTPLQAMRAHGRLLAGALVLAAVAIGASVPGAVLLREGRGGGEPDPNASVVANASEVDEAASPSASAMTGEYPTVTEQGLLDRLPSGVPARTCERATRILRVQVYPVTPSGIMPTRATWRSSGPTTTSRSSPAPSGAITTWMCCSAGGRTIGS